MRAVKAGIERESMDNQYLLFALLGIVVLAAAFIAYRHFRKSFDSGKYVIKEEDKLHITLESTDFQKVASIILEGLGGMENVSGSETDGSRMKVAIRKYEMVDEKKIRSSGVGGVLRPSKTAVHIIVGENAGKVKEAMDGLLET